MNLKPSNADRIEERVINNAKWILENKGTVRSCAVIVGCGKSTVYKDLVGRLPEIDGELFKEVHEVLMTNKEERYSRGGQAFKNACKRCKEEYREV